MKILFGVQHPIRARSRSRAAKSSKTRGTRSWHWLQPEPSLIPQLDVPQNVFLGQTEALNIVPRSSFKREILKPLAPRLPVTAKVSSLGMADMQVVEIARTLARGGQIIAFDEPTSSLTPAERDGLFDLIRI